MYIYICIWRRLLQCVALCCSKLYWVAVCCSPVPLTAPAYISMYTHIYIYVNEFVGEMHTQLRTTNPEQKMQ